MNFYYSFLLLLVVLSPYSESPPYVKPPDSTIVTVCPNSSNPLGVLAPVLTQNEVYMSTLPQNEVYMSFLPQNEVYMSFLPQNKVYMSILPQIGMSQTEVNITVLLGGEGHCFAWHVRVPF